MRATNVIPSSRRAAQRLADDLPSFRRLPGRVLSQPLGRAKSQVSPQ